MYVALFDANLTIIYSILLAGVAGSVLALPVMGDAAREAQSSSYILLFL